MPSLLQLLGIVGVIVAVVVLAGWPWALLVGSSGSVVVGYALERKRRPEVS